jgi:hypothetical protein
MWKNPCDSIRERDVESLKRENLGHGDGDPSRRLLSVQHTSVKRFLVSRAKFDEPAFYFAVHCLTNKPAFLGRTIVVLAHARAASISGDDRLLEGTFSEAVKVAAKDGLQVQAVTALK